DETLTACWTDKLYTYYLRTYLADTDGTYGDYTEYNFSAVYGTTVSSNDIWWGYVGFERDFSHEAEEITITDDDQYVSIYYKRKSYTITTSFTYPGESEAVTTTETFVYGENVADYLENSKPEYEGYSFVGWNFTDEAEAPATMPAHNLVATGNFVANDSTYYIRYYVQNLQEDQRTAADTYTLVTAKNRDLGGLCGMNVSFNEDKADNLEGFSYVGIALSYGNENGATHGDLSDAITTPIASKDSPLYINVYYDRNTYTATLNVWVGKVGGDNLIYTKDWDVLYGALMPENMNTYEQDLWTPVPDNHVLASYTGWSTDSEPATMPAGNVTATRQFIEKILGSYIVETYFETATGTYDKYTWTFWDFVGTPITLADTEQADAKTHIFTDLVQANPKRWERDYFDATEKEGLSVYDGVVTNTNEDGVEPIVLKVYYDRKVVTSTITYYYFDGTGTSAKKFATVTKKAKWGTQYNYDPLAFFEDEEYFREEPESKSIVNGLGIDPSTYDFLNNGYVASYSGHYLLNNSDHYKVYEFETEGSIAETTANINRDLCTMGYASNTVSVYYSVVDPLKQYRLKAHYNSGNLQYGTNVNVPLTYNDGTKTYTSIYIANEAYFHENVSYIPGNTPTYPGVGLYTESGMQYTYGAVKAEYTPVVIGGKTYYAKGDELYIPVSDNRFYVGHQTNYTFPVSGGTNEVGSQDALDFLTQYKQDHADSAYARGAYLYSHGWGTSIKFNTTDISFAITYRNSDTRTLYHRVGSLCGGHVYALGELVEELEADSAFEDKAGYEIKWYTDDTYATPVSLPIVMNSDIIVYGRYEKKTELNTVYAYYELADYPVVDGTTYRYITEKDTAFSDLLEASDPVITQRTSLSETGEEVVSDITTILYSYNGTVVMMKTQYPSVTYKEASIDVTEYGREGLHYDDANPNNVVKGYVQSEGIDFHTYYAREKYTLTVDYKKHNVNPEVSELRGGQSATLVAPTNDGYEFTGWVWTIADENGDYIEWTDAPESEDGNVSFTMPNASVRAEATWGPLPEDHTIFHYFKNTNGTYDTDTVKAMLQESGTEVTVSCDDTTYTGTKYTGGLSFTADDVTYYFANGEFADNVYTVSRMDLLAIREVKSYVQDETVEVAENILETEHFTFELAIHTVLDVVTKLKSTDSFDADYNTELAYYYTRETYSVTGSGFAVEHDDAKIYVYGSETNVTYGTSVSLQVFTVKGYEFTGWYEGTVAEVKEYTDLQLASEILSDEMEYTVRAEKNTNYVAVFKA
ncbi:MAG: hypothetical protein HUJ58_04425, partial [Erysipelotrichaceae bacterium]|nr:hypothetical protein [Erysipelotrichaceae bacterium]